MVKGKAKINTGEGLPPPQTRSFNSRKRGYPSDKAPETDNVPTAVHQKEKEDDDTGIVVASLLQSLVQKCASITNQQDQAAAEQTCATKKENHAEPSNVAASGKEEDNFTSPNTASQQGSCGLHTSNDTQKSRKNEEETASEKSDVSAHQTPAGQPQVISEDAGESCTTALEKEVDVDETLSLERNQDTGKEKSSTISTDDIKESAVGVPAKKKRRMGMCGLTEKERNQFLQAHKNESGPNRGEKVENLISDKTAQEKDTSSSLPSSPQFIRADCITEHSEEELKLQSSPRGEDDRAETEVQVSVATSDGTITVCDPGCSEEKAEVNAGSAPEVAANPASCQLAEEEEERLENLDIKGLAAENTAEICEKQMKKMEEGSTAHLSSDIACHTSQNENPENQTAAEAAVPQMIGTTRTDGTKGEGTSETKSRGPSCDSVELLEAAGTPGVPERKNNCDPDDDGDPPAGNSAEHTRSRNPDDTFGSGCIDFVSDSQLNTIVLTEEEVKKSEEDPHPSDGCDDATSLICGLIGELSSLNRKVMAAHRELENVRRSSKSSRSSAR